MIQVIKILSFITMWIIFGGLLALAIIFDGIYIQLVFDFGLMVVAAILGYTFKSVLSKA
ncbi:unnamed protein product [marine sediment metagenome]|uniref:Uncharacterized protein n=1 Tax=marine sediment metagenome TaxID=412755 RepID=X0ZWL2_9ZZZZ